MWSVQSLPRRDRLDGKILTRIENGNGTMKDIDLLVDIARHVEGIRSVRLVMPLHGPLRVPFVISGKNLKNT